MSIADKLNKLIDTKSKIKTSIESKGVTVGDIPFGEYSQKIDSISSGGGSTIVPKTITQNGVYNATDEGVDGYNPVTVDFGAEIDPSIPTVTYVDYDGRVIMQVKTKDFVAPPPDPVKEGCIFDGWTEDLTAITLNPYMDYTVGAHYTTDDGKTRIAIESSSTWGKSFAATFYLFQNASLFIEWGDGTTTTLTNASEGSYPVSHNYVDYGSYIIKVTSSGNTVSPDRKWGFYNNLNSGSFLASTVWIKSVEIGDGANLFSYAFSYCTQLETITTPSRLRVADSTNGMFYYCTRLKACFIKWQTATFSNIFYGCSSLKWLSLKLISAPNFDMTSFENCSSLQSLVLDKGSLAGSSIYPLSTVKCLILTQQTFMKMTTSNVFGTIKRGMKIYVPDDLVQTYKTATNWVAYANYIYPLSSRPLD